MINGDTVAVTAFLIFLSLLCWITWLYVLMFKRCRQLEVDNYRLMRRLGMYHSISIGTPDGQDTIPEQQDSSPVPAFFRTRKPTPPPGWRDPQKSKEYL